MTRTKSVKTGLSNINTLRVACWNTRGFSAAIPCLRELLSKNDVVAISEHWLHNNRLNLLNEASDKFFTHGRASRNASEESYGLQRGMGGVAIFWRKDMKGISKLETITHDRICGIRIQCQKGPAVVVLSVYMPASGSNDNLSVSLEELEGIIDSFEEETIPIICGDFNGNIGTSGGPRGTGPPTRAGRSVLKFMSNQNLKAINLLSHATGGVQTFEGHKGRSLIDYIMVPMYIGNHLVKCHTGAYEDLNTSDHIPISASISLEMLPRTILVDKSSSRIRSDKLDNNSLIDVYQNPLAIMLYPIENKIRDATGNAEEIDSFLMRLLRHYIRQQEMFRKLSLGVILSPIGQMNSLG